ncbi:MAG: hypothetical protein LBE82_11445 [Chitinophagaceae bacterium]|jgi:hypothetical protein|nr:hypothetical protein [Chitinophagaceae bacterium]
MNKEKIASVIQQLSQQLEYNADPTSLLITAQMLVAELQRAGFQPLPQAKNVCVVMPAILNITEERIAPASAMESIKETKEKPFIQPASQVMYAEQNNIWNGLDLLNEVPTLSYRNKAEESIEHTTKTNNGTNLAQSLQAMPIADLKKAIGVNDRFRFISELFRDDEVTFDRCIKTINGFHEFSEAELWMERELRIKYIWSQDNPVVKQFESLVKRRFMK